MTKARKATARANTARVLESPVRKESTARVTSTATVTRKARAKERKVKAKDRAKRRNRHPIRASWVIAGRVASEVTERTSDGKGMFKELKKFRVLLRIQWRRVQ